MIQFLKIHEKRIKFLLRKRGGIPMKRAQVLFFLLLFLFPFSLIAQRTHYDCDKKKIVIIVNGKVLKPTDPQAQEALKKIEEEMAAFDNWQDTLWRDFSRLEAFLLDEEREMMKIQQQLLEDLEKTLAPLREVQRNYKRSMPLPREREWSYPKNGAILVSTLSGSQCSSQSLGLGWW
ncbi:hypothetical protein A7K93_10955 [Candidatus Methylacidiphilum fumarolicum]|nr:hypothetical protein A7K73_00155 [Candidatus Methylacidiphilum fumarolicum]TFE71363.1 hypothetical protein A7K93_10955 [Candidatus Methylacidiphilum fumarolicum]TFE76860.1 hypothetical protein A7D33_08005 [Candidatus Methylacidiphilum fumarolicum]